MAKASDAYRPYQNMESKQAMHELLHNPDDHREILERYAASVVVNVTCACNSFEQLGSY